MAGLGLGAPVGTIADRIRNVGESTFSAISSSEMGQHILGNDDVVFDAIANPLCGPKHTFQLGLDLLWSKVGVLFVDDRD